MTLMHKTLHSGKKTLYTIYVLLLILFSFIAGFVTILSPCILPILPIVLSGSLNGGHRRPIGIVVGFVLSFTLFTLFLSAIVKATGLSPDLLRSVSVIIILFFGAALLLPNFQVLMEKLFTRLAGSVSGRVSQGSGFWSGILLGLSLGLVWTPCVGPIIASVITLAATSSVNGSAVLITLSYSIGTAIPMFAITYGGRKLLQKIPWLLRNTGNIQKVFGVLMILVAIGIFFNLDRKFQTAVLDKLPQYGAGLTKIEDNQAVKDQLEKVKRDKTVLDMGANMASTAPDFIAGGDWFNSKPLSIQSLKGKVVLVDFWTYTCINCIRTLPYLKSWYSKYEKNGFVIVGIHTPEFAFEKDSNNVKVAIADFQIKYPVMQDNDYATWGSYNNRYWPAHYLIDKNGKIRYTHFGEGEYDKTEEMIQKLLKETGADVSDKINNKEYEIEARTPETYLGYARMEGLASPQNPSHNTKTEFSIPKTLSSNSFAFEGAWTIEEEMAIGEEGSAIEYKFTAKNVYLVMNPIGSTAKATVFLDGKQISSSSSGKDVIDGTIIIDSNRLYELVKLQTPGEHTLKIEIVEGKVSAYAFTFG